jgi:hypothetical protein
VGGSITASRVSDADYFRDLSSRLSVTSQAYLPAEMSLTYGRGWAGNGSMVGLGLLPGCPVGIAATADQSPYGDEVLNGKTQIRQRSIGLVNPRQPFHPNRIGRRGLRHRSRPGA